MKSASLLGIFLMLAGCSVGTPRQSLPDQPSGILHDSDLVVYQFDRYDMTIVGTKGAVTFVYRPHQPPTVRASAESLGFRCVINGSYFEGTQLHAKHAGWLSLHGDSITPVMDDRQLYAVVRLIRSPAEVDIIPLQEFHSSPGPDVVEFQTGPIVVDSNNVAVDAIDASINGRGSYRRTLLAKTGDGMKWLLTVRKSVALDELGAYLITLPMFRGKRLDVVNLDGGPSVALCLTHHHALDFNAGARLPILLGVQ